MAELASRRCEHCGVRFKPKRATARFHSPACRKRASRARVAAAPEAIEQVETPAITEELRDGLVEAVRRELDACQRTNSALGQAALVLADRIVNGAGETGSAIASLTLQLRETLAAATANSKRKGSVVDELRQKRESRRA